MTLYSHSRLSTFEQCRYKYKLKYLDKIPSPVEKSIEAHLGQAVHAALEWLYQKVLAGKVPELDEVIEKYSNSWADTDTEKMVIVRNLSKKDYFNKGVKFLIDYYMKYKPFNDGTLETEKKIWVNLEKNFPHKFIGYIDRLVYDKEKDQYEIHDYKTANTLPNKDKFANDRQLAIYSLGLKEKIAKGKPIILTWHYLNYNMKITSSRTDEELEKLRKDTIELINKIEKTTEFPPTKTPLCDWCEYKQYCKAWGNSIPPEIQKNKNIKTTKELKKVENNSIEKNFPTLSKYLID